MNDQEKLYALALALVDDADAAGDLFMDAAGEADLWRRAARWRRRHGLPDVPAGAVSPVPLTPDLKEHAAHLARRARVRRGMKAGVAVALSLVAVVLLALDLAGVTNLTAYAERGLGADPAFRGQPIAVSQEFAIYKTDATPGSITIWWAVQGRDAEVAAKANPVELTFRGGRITSAIKEETAAPRSDRVVGKSTFRAPVTQTMPVLVTAGNWKLQVLVDPVPEPGARVVPAGKSVVGLDGRVVITVESVTLGSTYTTVRYRLEGEEINTARAYLVYAVADLHRLDLYGPMRLGLADGEREMVFGPVPPGTQELELRFPRLGQNGEEPVVSVSLGN